MVIVWSWCYSHSFVDLALTFFDNGTLTPAKGATHRITLSISQHLHFRRTPLGHTEHLYKLAVQSLQAIGYAVPALACLRFPFGTFYLVTH
ncbi:MAG: hypothetical protein IKV83_06100 [Muribaculaceae bacterium]|nr:hypothetical protein [Muribaculaceae bacterium]